MEGTSVGYADMGTGLLFFTPKMWLGAALHHLNRPNQSLLQNEAMVPMKFSMQGGYRIHVRTPVIQKNPQSFVFAFNYKSQQKYDQLDLGIYFEREPFFMGLWYRGLPLMKHYAPGYGNNDALAVLVGTIIEDLRIGYSYDITVSRLAGQSAGAHELTIGYEDRITPEEESSEQATHRTLREILESNASTDEEDGLPTGKLECLSFFRL